LLILFADIITLSGFANESLITIGSLFLVVGAVERSHAVDYMARKAFGSTGSDIWGKCRMYIICFCLSVFFNNTPLVAVLLPVVKDWGRMRNIAASQLLMPMSFAVLAGSFGSMIGTSANLTVQALMQADRGYSFNFFAPAPIGFPIFVLVLIYMLIAAPYLLPTDKSGLIRAVKDKAEKLVAEVYVSKDSMFVGRPLSQMMGSLGLATSLAMKIRRKVLREDEKEFIPPDRSFKSRMHELITNLQDPSYLRRISGFWSPTQLRKNAASKDNLSNLADGETSKGDYELAAAYPEDGNTSGTSPMKGTIKTDDYIDIVVPNHHETMAAGDIVFIAYAQDVVEKMMKSIAGETKGLYVLKSNALDLPGYGTELVECILSDSSPFLGRTVGSIAQEFSDRYQVGLITVRGKDWGNAVVSTDKSDKTSEGEPTSATVAVPHGPQVVIMQDPEAGIEIGQVALSHAIPTSEEEANASSKSPSIATGSQEDKKAADENSLRIAAEEQKVISDHVLQYGDIVLGVTDRKHIDSLHRNREFFVVSTVGELPIPMTLYSFFPVMVFVTMLILAATETLDICPGSMMVASVFFIGGWIKAKEIPKLIDIRLLMLIGTSLSFAKAMTRSGLAEKIAQSINDSHPSNFQALLLMYVITLVITELISNNAAAALMYPIASALADEMGVDFKPFAMAILVSCTAGFMCPIGYQTHIMVWGPGGYSFWNFVFFGLTLDVIYWIFGCLLIVALFPF
jgi:di/tricarboxylate transporter